MPAGILITVNYTANLISYVTVSQLAAPITSLAEFHAASDWTFASDRGIRILNDWRVSFAATEMDCSVISVWFAACQWPKVTWRLASYRSIGYTWALSSIQCQCSQLWACSSVIQRPECMYIHTYVLHTYIHTFIDIIIIIIMYISNNEWSYWH